MILKIKNNDPDSWVWIDDVTKVTSIPCTVKENRDGDEEFEISNLKDTSTRYIIDRYYRWPLKVGDFVNVLVIYRGKPFDEMPEIVVVEDSGTYILGTDGKTIDRI